MKLGFLFGAGAELDYGMPSGGSFALDIFRQDSTLAKNMFKKMRDAVDDDIRYASAWLPKDYKTKNISSFGKTVFEAIIKDTIEHNRDKIIDKLNHFDSMASAIVDKLKKIENIDVDAAFSELKVDVRNVSMMQKISFIDVFQDGNRLFDNMYFSALLKLYASRDKLDTDDRMELRKILVAILQLQIGALGENLSRRISDNLFSKKMDEVDIFDDLGELFQLNYRSTGVSGLEYLLDSKKSDVSTSQRVVLRFAQEILEGVFAAVLDYKSLIDGNWHYLYCPSVEWAKFCKISIFLITVRNYIEEQCRQADLTKRGYYHDLALAVLKGKMQVSKIATTNYTGLISSILKEEITFLNGSTSLWYDPYINRIGMKEELLAKEKHIIVPLMFTQSGTKPMTSIDMSIRYVDMYHAFNESDYICCVGFGFNPDDEHINGVLRTLVDKGKTLVVVCPYKNSSENSVKMKIANQLKTMSEKNIRIVFVDRNRECEGRNWLEYILNWN